MSGHTPGPWRIDPRPFSGYGAVHVSGGQYIVAKALGQTQSCETEATANARLIATAPDHIMIASALCSGAARWEPFASGSGGEFCIGGIRHATRLDEFGVPVMTDGMRIAIAEATGETP